MKKTTLFLVLLVNICKICFAQNLPIPIRTANGNCIYIKYGEPVFNNKEYQSADVFKNGRAAVSNVLNDFYGFIDTLGNNIIPYIYKYASGFVDSRARVKNFDNTYGYINSLGKEVIPQIYKSASDFWCGVASVSKVKNQYILIDTNGTQILSSPFWAKIKEIEYDVNGEKIPFYFYQALTVSDVVKGLRKKEIQIANGKIKEVLTSLSGEQIGSANYDKIDLDYFKTNPYIKVYSADSGTYGLINAAGKIILPISNSKY